MSFLKTKFRDLRKDYGNIGFWAAFSAIFPIIGLIIFSLTIYSISPWLKANAHIGVPGFIISVSILAGLALLPTNVVGIVSGWAFGFSLGLFAMLSAIFGAVTINYFIARKLSGKSFEKAYSKKPKLKAVHDEILEGNTFKVILVIMLLRLSPATPFAATNFLISASGVSIYSYTIATVLAYIPRTAATVFVGSSLRKLDFDQPNQTWLIIIGIVATIAGTALIAILSKKALSRITDKES